MASTGKRGWKLQEFSAHAASVNCLSLGGKSGRVLVTGGDDRKVNLWAVGKPSCIMSLGGHTTAIEAVRFSPTEELVCAGSAAGAVKVWDLEAARMVRTLTGHRGGIRALDFHPYGDFLATGSADTNIKLWDIRRKGCIFTYKGHGMTVNSLRFSPDGQWVASAGEDGAVKIWDLRAGRLLSELREHTASVNEVEFHPHEFLLASGGADRRVLFWDLENFSLVSNSESETNGVRSIYFHPEGKCLFSASNDGLRVYGWEPLRLFDCIPLPWGRIQDMAVTSSQLIGVSSHLNNVTIYVVDLKKVAPFGGPSSSNNSAFRHGQPLRKSFNRDKPISGNRIKMHEESDEKSSTETEDDGVSLADIKNLNDYHAIFQPRSREISRTPPPPDSKDLDKDPRCVTEEKDKLDPTMPEVIRPPPPDLVQQHSPLSTPAASPLHRPSPSPSPPYKTQTGPGRPITLRERRNSTSSVTVSTKIVTSYSGVEKVADADGLYYSNPQTPTGVGSIGSNLNNMASARPDVTNSAGLLTSSSGGSGGLAAAAAAATSRGRNPQRNNLVQRRESIREILQPSLSDPENPPRLANIRHSPSEPALHQRSQSTSRSSSLSRNRPDLTAPIAFKAKMANSNNIISPVTSNFALGLQDYAPSSLDRSTGLDLEDFLPRKFPSLSLGQSTSMLSSMDDSSLAMEQTELEIVSNIVQGHQPMMTVLASRHRHLQVVFNLWQNKDAKVAVETAVGMNDPAVIVDLLSVIVYKPFLWSLDLCVFLLPAIGDLLQSKFESYVGVACTSLRLIMKNFAAVIKTNIEGPVHSVGVDISRHERYNKCMSCYSQLVPIKAFVLKRQAVAGKLGQTFRELHLLLQIFE